MGTLEEKTGTFNLDIIRRQITIASLISENQDKLSLYDLMDLIGASEKTVERTLQALRTQVNAIHSKKRKFSIDMDLKQTHDLLSVYMGLENRMIIRNIKRIHKQFAARTLSFFVKTCDGISHRRILRIAYGPSGTRTSAWREVTPASFYANEKSLYLLAVEDSIPKLFAVERIRDFQATTKKSGIKTLPSLEEFLRSSWGVFTGGEPVRVRLLFDSSMASYLEEKYWAEDQAVTVKSNGVELSMTLKLSFEFISWVMGWGKEVKILEPKSLKDEVMKRAKEIVGQN
ncbi:WYL domain-containing protein [bacterium]|nr:WYL domain-containing protein [bacterium]